MIVFIGACCIMADAEPSDWTTALIALVWHMNRKMPDMIYNRKSPWIVSPLIPISSNIA
jgi:hypothetical protein